MPRQRSQPHGWLPARSLQGLSCPRRGGCGQLHAWGVWGDGSDGAAATATGRARLGSKAPLD